VRWRVDADEIHLEGPRQIIAEDLSHPSLLGTGEYGAGYGSRSEGRWVVAAETAISPSAPSRAL
jgi:hypothetical protein